MESVNKLNSYDSEFWFRFRIRLQIQNLITDSVGSRILVNFVKELNPPIPVYQKMNFQNRRIWISVLNSCPSLSTIGACPLWRSNQLSSCLAESWDNRSAPAVFQILQVGNAFGIFSDFPRAQEGRGEDRQQNAKYVIIHVIFNTKIENGGKL